MRRLFTRLMGGLELVKSRFWAIYYFYHELNCLATGLADRQRRGTNILMHANETN